MRTAHDIYSVATSRIENVGFAINLQEARNRLSRLARQYVEAGEREEWHLSPSFAQILASEGQWYSLRNVSIAPILFIKTMQYTPLVFWNDGHLLPNQRLYNVTPLEGVDAEVLCATLNSTIFAAERYAAVKALGREAAIDVEVFTAKVFRVPNIRGMDGRSAERLREAMNQLCQRDAGALIEEPLEASRVRSGIGVCSPS